MNFDSAIDSGLFYILHIMVAFMAAFIQRKVEKVAA